MLSLPSGFASVILAFAPLFRHAVWNTARLLLIGAILAPGKRTVTSVLRILGQSDNPCFQNYHRWLNRIRWSPRQASRILLGLLVKTFALRGPLLVGLDDTIERRWGRKIAARGIYRDPVRSSHSHFVKASGLRWLSLMLLVEIPWAQCVWALPFLTVLVPSERYHQTRKKQHKSLLDWGRQMLKQCQRWHPGRRIILVVDSAYAALEFLNSLTGLRHPITCLTRLRLDAALYEPAPPRKKGRTGRPRKKGARLPTLRQVLTNHKTVWQRITVAHWYGQSQRALEIVTGTAVWYHAGLPAVPIRWVLIRDPQGEFKPQALLSTDLTLVPRQMVQWFVRRWQLEVTFEEVRAHTGIESQRQWSDLAIARTTPCLLGLFSLTVLLAADLARRKQLKPRQAAWYTKEHMTFSDTIAAVRQQLWNTLPTYSTSPKQQEIIEMPRLFLNRLLEALCYAA
jgi:DDE superfamily endonuclease